MMTTLVRIKLVSSSSNFLNKKNEKKEGERDKKGGSKIRINEENMQDYIRKICLKSDVTVSKLTEYDEESNRESKHLLNLTH